MKNSKFLIVIVLLLSTVVCFAQNGTGFDDNVADVPAAPINQWVFAAITVAVLFGTKASKKL